VILSRKTTGVCNQRPPSIVYNHGMMGYRQALHGTAWATQLAPTSAEQLPELIVDPASKFDL